MDLIGWIQSGKSDTYGAAHQDWKRHFTALLLRDHRKLGRQRRLDSRGLGAASPSPDDALRQSARSAGLKAQAKGQIQAAVEMANVPEGAVATLASITAYVASYAEAFPDADEPLSFDNLAKAIEAYKTSLVTPDAPFDRWLRGEDDALDPLAKQGVARFIDKGCTACHNGVNVGGQAYFPFGLTRKPAEHIRPPADKGRFEVTQTPNDA
ncbi:cytochrome-c peroxidase [Thiorhodovibrio winogradskyi]|uniref:cytochrome-c peroxidase n=1 Tax=Thiorhodovibrio winogradskyi TaxID=77007 RepID=UPI002E2A0892|nr:cytochrome c peroxidase [Thiorhodovibrio winogradskyi]